jgi:predicted  nucleic acid-binding Zn-ribbon protein
MNQAHHARALRRYLEQGIIEARDEIARLSPALRRAAEQRAVLQERIEALEGEIREAETLLAGGPRAAAPV